MVGYSAIYQGLIDIEKTWNDYLSFEKEIVEDHVSSQLVHTMRPFMEKSKKEFELYRPFESYLVGLPFDLSSFGSHLSVGF